MLRTYSIRSDERPVVSFVLSGSIAWTNTKDASPTELPVPTPTAVFGVKSTGAATSVGPAAAAYVNSLSSAPAPLKAARDAEPAAPSEAQKMPDVPGGDAEAVADEKEWSWSAEPAAEASGGAEAGEQPPSPDVEAPRTPDSATRLPVWAQAIEGPPAFEAETPKIDLSIDSLPHLQLVEPIPVTVTHMGDKLYTATIDAIRLSGTSTTMSEALVTVKEEIESLFGRLTKSTRLHADEERDLQYLLAHIRSSEQPREYRRGLWR